MDQSCPRCGNTQTARTEMVWHSQVSHQHQKSGVVVGAVMAEDGLIPGIGWQSGTTTVTMTDLAKTLQPPMEPRGRHRIHNRFGAILASYFAGVGLGGTLGTLVSALVCIAFKPTLFHSDEFPVWANVVMLALALGGAGTGMWVAWRYFRRPASRYGIQREAYARALDVWLTEWFCPRCGHRWVPPVGIDAT